MAKATKTPLQVTSISDLQKYAEGQIIELPAFAEGQPFVARLRRPSMLALVRAGKIPNALLKTANSLFLKSSVNEKDESAMNDLFQVFDTLCEASFVDPTWAQLKEANVQLTDDQLMFVFNYTQQGVRALDSFHKES